MLTPGFLNDPLPVRSSDKTKSTEKAGAIKPHRDRIDDFHTLVERENMPGSGRPQTENDVRAVDADDNMQVQDNENMSGQPEPVTGHFSAALLFPVIVAADEAAEQAVDDVVMETAPETDDDAAMKKMPPAPVVDMAETPETIDRADRAGSVRVADRPLASAQKADGEGISDKAAQPVQKAAVSPRIIEKAADGQGEKTVAENISRKGMETVAKSSAGEKTGADSNSKGNDGQGAAAAGQDKAAPRLNAADLSASATSAHPAEKPAQLAIGDKIMLKAPAAENPVPARIEAVEVLSSRSNGAMRQLHLQLTPENLGTVEARLRLHEGGLIVELRAAQTETARFLARDHEMLVTLLERSGFKDQSRISLTISDQNGTFSHRVAMTAQLTGEQSAGQNSGGQNWQDVRAGTQGSGQNGRGGNRQDSEGAASHPRHNGRQPDEGDGESHARRPIRGLVV